MWIVSWGPSSTHRCSSRIGALSFFLSQAGGQGQVFICGGYDGTRPLNSASRQKWPQIYPLRRGNLSLNLAVIHDSLLWTSEVTGGCASLRSAFKYLGFGSEPQRRLLYCDSAFGPPWSASETWYDGHIWQSAKSIEKYGKVPSHAIHDVMQVPALPVPREATDQNGQVSDSQCQQLLS